MTTPFDEDDAWLPWTDRYGMVHTQRTAPTLEPSTRNGVLYTSEAYILRYLHGNLQPYQIERFGAIIQQCFVGRGILGRGPGIKDQEGPDDYIGAAAASCILGVPYLANNILWWGSTHWFCLSWWCPKIRYFYNNVNPGTTVDAADKPNWSAWIGWHPARVAHLWLANHIRPSLYYRLGWTFGLLWTAFTAGDKQDPWSQDWLMVQTYRHSLAEKNWLMDWAVRQWVKALRKQWGEMGSMQKVQLAYLQNPMHPFTLYWNDFL